MPKLLHGRYKEILTEVFHARPGEVEEIIQRRLEESGPEGREEERWPATFCVGSSCGAGIEGVRMLECES